MAYYNRFGQFICKEPRGRAAGYDWPQLSIHRGDLHQVLIDAVRERLGQHSILLDKRCEGVDQDDQGVTARFADGSTARGTVAIACDGIHSAVRKQLYPDEGGVAYQGINMWRGVTRWKPYLSGMSMVQIGWLSVGKMVIYPIGKHVEADGLQLINWVAEIQSPRNIIQDWNLGGKLEDFLPTYADWHFDWLDVPEMIRNAEQILEYPMVDRDPLPAWTRGRVTLLGDAAHPMWPIGSNGASQAILDTEALAQQLAPHVAQAPGLTQALPNALPAALLAYEALRRPATAAVVLANRRGGPDQVLQLAEERAPDGFDDIEQVIPLTEREAIAARYKQTAGFDKSLVNQQAQSQQQQ
jgi:2-polyprenyl-6-methoxyphenol hydroxylase-like FAD-dependent oxidoreductase